MPVYTHLTPHTSAWFEQVLERFPKRAVSTLMIISMLNGDISACSICGDKPASNYQLQSDDTNTWKFCSDCLGIRKTVYSEAWIRMIESVQT